MQIAAPWIPSSSVAHITLEGMCRIEETQPELKILRNVHDSALIQGEAGRTEEFKAIIREAFSVELNYPSRLIIPVDVVSSTLSWGEVAG